MQNKSGIDIGNGLETVDEQITRGGGSRPTVS